MNQFAAISEDNQSKMSSQLASCKSKFQEAQATRTGMGSRISEKVTPSSTIRQEQQNQGSQKREQASPTKTSPSKTSPSKRSNAESGSYTSVNESEEEDNEVGDDRGAEKKVD